MPWIAGLAAAAAIALDLFPAEIWFLPVAILSGPRLGALCRASGAGGFIAVVLLFALGAWGGGGESISFVIDTSGLKSIHDFQSARELFGDAVPFFVGWVNPFFAFVGGSIPSARDMAVMAGQRGAFSPWLFVLLVALQFALRSAALAAVAALARRTAVVREAAASAAVPLWFLLALLVLF